MEFKNSETKKNLIKAFAGESQARNRYTFAAEAAKKEGLAIIEKLFYYTADQEKAHAKVFYDKLKEFNGENIEIDASYPIGNYEKTLDLLRDAEHNEQEEYDVVYKSFAQTAAEEGFGAVAKIFENIAAIENVHSKRFKKYADKLENDSLFKETQDTLWMCSNCGFIFEGKEAPKACPVCSHPQGYFMLFSTSEFE
ncbi:MAG: rubrerythrin family protein [Clostridiaceae bacterium]|nr:rubrerythrin family protein [Clostridiaceae bacterium]